jgi:hypothetical protein
MRIGHPPPIISRAKPLRHHSLFGLIDQYDLQAGSLKQLSEQIEQIVDRLKIPSKIKGPFN